MRLLSHGKALCFSGASCFLKCVCSYYPARSLENPECRGRQDYPETADETEENGSRDESWGASPFSCSGVTEKCARPGRDITTDQTARIPLALVTENPGALGR